MRRFSPLALLIAAVVTPVAGVALGSSREHAPTVSSVTTKTPSGRTVKLTVRKGKRSAAAWCASVVIRDERPLSGRHCDRGASPGLHGAYVADCPTRELIAYGAVRGAVTVLQPRRGRHPIVAKHAPRPRGVRFNGDHYVIAVDLRQAHPRLLARQAGRTIATVGFAREARKCVGLGVVGAF